MQVYLQRSPTDEEGTVLPDVQEFMKLMEDLNNLPPQTRTFQPNELPAPGEQVSSLFSQVGFFISFFFPLHHPGWIVH